MLKRLLLSAIVLSAISGSSYAVDVKLPGADPSISRDAYVQAVYTTDKIESTYDERLKKKADSFSAYSKERFNQEFGVVVDDDAVEALKNEIYTIERRKYDGNTVVNLHNKKGGLSVTLPFSVVQKEALSDFPDAAAGYLFQSPMIVTAIIENKMPYSPDKTDMVFKYDGLSKSYWRKITLTGAVDMDIIALNFELSKHPKQAYNVILYPRVTESVTSNDINKIMANYVLPSIHSLQELDDYSKVETYKTYSFRVPKTAVKDKKPNERVDGVSFTINKDINQQIRIEPNNESKKGLFSTVDEIRILNKIDNKSAELFGISGAKMITKGFHTYVWNDGIPGLLLDIELDNQQGILMFITYDENHKYINTIQYPLDNGVYSKAQLRRLITDVKLSSTGNLYAGDVWIV